MIQTDEEDTLVDEEWDGVERRSGVDRRKSEDRRETSRTTWQRRSGHDRRGHKLYSRPKPPQVEP